MKASQVKKAKGKARQERIKCEQTFQLKTLKMGDYFGEIGILTNLKRTTTCKASNFCTLSSICKERFQTAKDSYVHVYQAFKSRIRVLYTDFDFSFRRKMIRNIPYFRLLDDILADEIVQCLKPRRYEAGTDIVKRGDNIDQIMLLKAG